MSAIPLLSESTASRLLGHAHPFGDVGLGQAECLAPFGQPMAVDVCLVTMPGPGYGLLAAGPGDDVVPDDLPFWGSSSSSLFRLRPALFEVFLVQLLGVRDRPAVPALPVA